MKTELDVDDNGAASSDADGVAEVDRLISSGMVDEGNSLARTLKLQCGEPHQSLRAAELQLRIALCDLEQSRVDRAREGAGDAAMRFRRLGHPQGEIAALALWSRTASRQAQHGEAIEHAMLAKRLSENEVKGLWTLDASLALSTAYCWAGQKALALRELSSAGRIADPDDDGPALLAVTIQRLWSQVVSREGVADRTLAAVAAHQAQAEVDDLMARALVVRPGYFTSACPAFSLEYAATAAVGIVAARAGLVEMATQRLGRCADLEKDQHQAGWLLAAKSWLQSEVSCACGDLEAAVMHAKRLSSWAVEVQHIPMAMAALGLTSELFGQMGRADRAIDELRELLSLKQRAQSAFLDTRAEAVEREYAARDMGKKIDLVVNESRRLERWAFEDDLTGLPNLRRYRHQLEAWENEGGAGKQPMCIALIDVDRFKAINDRIGHEGGDVVLRGIADAMRDSVRVGDLPARWGGDEFAILLPNTELAEAQRIADRVESAVKQKDWASLAADLRVGVSIGVVQAFANEQKSSLKQRADAAMYARKADRRRDAAAHAVPPEVVNRLGRWMRAASRVVLYVGSAPSHRAVSSVSRQPAPSAPVPSRYLLAEGLSSDAAGFSAYWADWRRQHRSTRPAQSLKDLVSMSHHLRDAVFVSERIDSALAMAGATNVIEIYGNGFRNRCNACGRINPNTSADHCIACGCPNGFMRPDVTLLGERPNERLLAGATLAAKRADVLLVVDWDGSLHPSSGLIEKARIRGAKVVVLGAGPGAGGDFADVWIREETGAVLAALASDLADPTIAEDAVDGLSDAGFEVLCFLSGLRSDDRGIRFDEALAWSDWEVECNLATLPWIFPLVTPSRMNPVAPMPNRHDFELLSHMALVREAMQRAFGRMLRFYGFETTGSAIRRSEGWEKGFANWATRHSHHDLFISRILAALSGYGLGELAKAWFDVLRPELLHYRGRGWAEVAGHWRMALGTG